MLNRTLKITALFISAFSISCASQKSPASLESSSKKFTVADISAPEAKKTYSQILPPPKPVETKDLASAVVTPPAVTPVVTDAVIGQEVENTIAPKKLGEVPLPEVPLVLNQQVQKWMDYFQGRGRKYFALWLARSGRYVPMMKQVLSENGLPEGLIYLSMIESGFRPYALSHAKAAGPWQFMKFTGERYGLRVNYWIDERLDPEKSTLAAAQHLKDLYDEFDHWYLAAAGYNAGAGKISRAIVKYQTEDFWEMSKHKYIKPETKNYVPKLLAASLLASDPEKYGFTDIQYETPVPYERVLVPEPVSLETISQQLNVSVETLKDLNPELKHGATPPNYPNYEMKVPVGYQTQFLALYPDMPRYKAQPILVHNVRKGETIAKIARKYGVTSSSIVSSNHLNPKRALRKGQEIMIPIVEHDYPVMAKAEPKKFELASSSKFKSYVVRAGDTLWNISRKFNVTVSELRAWNRLHNSSIQKGQKLAISNPKKNTKKSRNSA